MNVFKFILFISIGLSSLHGQRDSAAYGSLGFQLQEGLYQNIDQLRQNKPITKSQIKDKRSQEALDYFNELTKNSDTIYLKDLKATKLSLDSIWGFCQNNQIYIQFDQKFFKVPLFGKASTYLVFVKQMNPRPMYNPWLYDPYFNNTYNGFGGINNNPTSTVTIQMLLDYETGLIQEFSLEALEEILKRDEKLYKEFSSLKKKKRKEKAIFYLRKYNMLHPIYFPKL
jgi:hypothetical protein